MRRRETPAQIRNVCTVLPKDGKSSQQHQFWAMKVALQKRKPHGCEQRIFANYGNEPLRYLAVESNSMNAWKPNTSKAKT